jgi:hypothetical protein
VSSAQREHTIPTSVELVVARECSFSFGAVLVNSSILRDFVRTRCQPCATGYYCVAGAATVSGKCPANGFDCSKGRLRQLDGYWLPPDAVLFADGSVGAHRCLHGPACLGRDITAVNASRNDSGCATGYRDNYCMNCADGWAGLSGICTKCHSLALTSIGLATLPFLGVLIISFITTISLEERIGVPQVSVM